MKKILSTAALVALLSPISSIADNLAEVQEELVEAKEELAEAKEELVEAKKEPLEVQEELEEVVEDREEEVQEIREDVVQQKEFDAFADEDEKGVLTISIENDITAGTDSHYTNGFRLSYISPENQFSKWFDNAVDYLPFFQKDGDKRLGFAVGQNIYTPLDLTRANPDPLDRPYAGWLHADFSVTSDTDDRLDFVELSVGVVGPSSLADHTQETVHSFVPGAVDPQGWDFQLEDELALMLSYQRKWKNTLQAETNGYTFDFIPHAGFSVGNVFTQAAFGGTIRFGEDLPLDYGPPLIRPSFGGSDFFTPSANFGWYLFAGVEGRAVGHNIFLDGNTFKDSREVDREYFVGDLQGGIAITYGDTRISYTHIVKTQEFKTQVGYDAYGSLNISTRF